MRVGLLEVGQGAQGRVLPELPEFAVAPQMVANRNDLDMIATSDEPDVKALRGWRKVVFGADAIALKNGRLALTGDYERVRVIDLPADPTIVAAAPAPTGVG